MLFQQGHGLLDLLIYALAPAGVIGLLKALQGNGGNEILHPQHLLAEALVDQGAVGEREELTIRVHLAQLDEIRLTYQRLAASVNVHVGAKLLALADDGIHGFQAEVELVSILSRPTAGAVHIAGGGGGPAEWPRGHCTARGP